MEAKWQSVSSLVREIVKKSLFTEELCSIIGLKVSEVVAPTITKTLTDIIGTECGKKWVSPTHRTVNEIGTLRLFGIFTKRGRTVPSTRAEWRRKKFPPVVDKLPVEEPSVRHTTIKYQGLAPTPIPQRWSATTAICSGRNQEGGIEQLKIKRQELSHEIEQEEAAKHTLENEMQQLQMKLDGLSTNIKQKRTLLENCDKAIKEAESAFMKSPPLQSDVEFGLLYNLV
ncbi:unnamed protein product [Nezara viridula]|uniref:Uncharacterized protein n=1 Tax=Nezara viridula TaxID=85310 RepID=A0A9P0H858_NEZVI|nr:unnamed protein product [Nezara viridula]